MATANVAAIQKLYVAYFNRPADPLGLQAWQDAMTRGATIDDIAKAFAGSDEYKAAYAGMNAVSTIAAIYQNLFGREADPAGLKFWAGHLQAGDFTVDVAVKLIADAAQGTDATIVANRVSYATAFTSAVDTTPEIVGYSGAAANNAAKAILTGITTDASLTAAIAPAALNSAVAGVVDKANTAAGQSFTLTTGVDTFTGTAYNDTFTVNTYTTSGTSATTLQSFDSIDGGAGVDTLNVFAAAGFNNVLTGSVKNVEMINIVGSDAIGSSLTATQLGQIATARENVTTAQTALTAAQAAETTANANVTVVTASSTVITAYVNAIDTTGTQASPDTAFATVVAAVGQASNDATKNFVLNYLNSHKNEIYNETIVTGTPPVSSQVPRTAEAVLTEAINAANAAAEQAVDNAEGAATAASNTTDQAELNLTAANTALNALPTANHASVSAAFFGGSTQIKVDGSLTDVTGVTGQNVVFTGTNVTNNVTYGANATTGTITLTGTRGTINVDGDKLATVNLNGSVSKAGAAAGTVTLVEGTTLDTDVVKTLNVGLTTAAKLNVAGMTALTTIAAGASTGALTIDGASGTVSSITTGSGADTVTLATVLSSTVKTASVSTGAGNDDITVNLIGTGSGLTATVDAGDGDDMITISAVGNAKMTIKAGAGNDTVIFNDLDTVATADLVDGGEGTDTIAIRGATLRAADYVVLSETVTNFEGIAFLGAQTSVDASRIASYKSITLSNAEGSLEHSEVVGVANDQTVNIKSTYNSGDIIDITAAGYDSTGATTVYAGALNVNVSGITPAEGLISVQANYGVDVNVFASSVNLAVSATATSSSYVNLGGDVKSATVTLASAAVTNATTGAQTGLNSAAIVVNTSDEVNSKLASLTLKGDGYAEVYNNDNSSLVTIDASGLTSHYWDSTDKALKVDSALEYTSYNTKVETITLGAGQDYIDLRASTFKATDTVTGLNLVVDVENSTATNKVLDTDASDLLEVGTTEGHIYSFTAVEADDLTGNSLNTVLRNLGLASAAQGAESHNFVFQFQGNTYVYADIGATAGTYDGLTDNDVLVKLTGTVDLDLLKQALAYND